MPLESIFTDGTTHDAFGSINAESPLFIQRERIEANISKKGCIYIYIYIYTKSSFKPKINHINRSFLKTLHAI